MSEIQAIFQVVEHAKGGFSVMSSNTVVRAYLHPFVESVCASSHYFR